ncbi:MAG: S8 family serine peptidase [Candidatus Obscuribacterales bacterium]|nr:S8 family serine peptidase [Candidatus Obscuribacterales bacterium]
MKIARTSLNGSSIKRRGAVALAALSLMLSSSLSLAAKADNVTPSKVIGQSRPATAAHYTSDELIIMPKASVDKEDLDASIDKMGGKVGTKDLMGKFFIVKVDPKHIDEILKEAQKDKNFAMVQRNGVYKAQQFTTTPNDPGFPQQFYLGQLNIPNAWALGAAGQGITIGSLDTGIDYYQPELVGRMKSIGYNAVMNAANGYDFFSAFGPDAFSHGTFTMTCAACTTNNAFGFASPAFQSQIQPVCIDVGNGASDMQIALGIEYLLLTGVKLANLSFNSADPNFNLSVLSSAPIIKYASSVYAGYGGIIFNSAGNDGNLINGVTIPGFVPVAALNADNTPASFTDYGAQIQFAAPGVGITNTGFSGAVYTLDGTSFASPLTAGVAAQVWSVAPNLTATQVQQIMQSTASVPTGADKRFYGYGIPNAAAAVSLAQNSFQ